MFQAGQLFLERERQKDHQVLRAERHAEGLEHRQRVGGVPANLLELGNVPVGEVSGTLGQAPYHLVPPAGRRDDHGRAELLELVEILVDVSEVEVDGPAQTALTLLDPSGGPGPDSPGAG